MSLSIARADETTKVTFRLIYQDPAEGGPDDASEREREFATEADAEGWVDEGCVVGLRIDLVERVYNRRGSIVFTYIDSARYDPARGY
jgi:hypothetical protein